MKRLDGIKDAILLALVSVTLLFTASVGVHERAIDAQLVKQNGDQQRQIDALHAEVAALKKLHEVKP